MASFLGALLTAATTTGGTGESSRTNNKDGATLRIVDLISEGPIVGLANDEQANRSIFINDLPIEGNDASFNYDGVKWTFLSGEESQSAPTGFGVVETTTGVGREVELGQPVVIRVRGRDIDAVRLSIRFNAMFKQNDDGSTSGASAQLKFEAKVISDTEYLDAGTAHVAKKSTSAFERNYRVDFTPLRERDPSGLADEDIDIRISRLDAKSTSLRLSNDSFLASYVSLSEVPIAYANSAIVAMEIDAETFGSNPTKRTFDIVGLKVQVPSNYVPVSHEYTSLVWNGSFSSVLQWSDNPVWLLYALLTNPRYGLGNVISPDQIDKFSFYAAAVYCDEKVPNGEGGESARFTFNGTINTTRGAYDTLNLIAATCRARLLWSTGQVSLVQDRPQVIKGVVTKANVEGGNFTYTGSGLSVRHTAAKISWVNPDDNWQVNYEIAENNKAAQNDGWRQIDANGYGITSRAQARRLGLWILQTEQNETEIVNYNAGLDQVTYGPGDIIAIADSLLNNRYAGGRVMEVNDSSTDSKTLRFDKEPPILKIGNIVWITTNNPDAPIIYARLTAYNSDNGLWTIRGQRITKFSTVAGDQIRFEDIRRTAWRRTVLDFGPGAIWTVFDPLERTEPKLWRIISVEETGPGLVKVDALEYYAAKFDLVDSLAAKFAGPEETEFQLQPPSTVAVDVESITLEPYTYRVNGVVQASATLAWEPIDDPRIIRYIVEFSSIRDSVSEATLGSAPGLNGFIYRQPFIYNWELLGTTPDSALVIANFERNPYYIRIRWIDDQGRFGPRSQVKTFEPGTFEDEIGAFDKVENFQVKEATAAGGGTTGLLLFTWDPINSVLLSHYEIRHSVDNVGWEFANQIDGGSRITTTNFDTISANGFYYIRVFSVNGNESESSVVQSRIATVLGLNITAEYFRPLSASTASDTDNIARLEALETLGAGSNQASGTIIRDWVNTASRLHRDLRGSYLWRIDRMLGANNLLRRFYSSSVDPESGLSVRDWTKSWYPRIGLIIRAEAFDERGEANIRTDDVEATNSEVIDNVLYSEPLAVMANWSNLDYPESICVHKSAEGTSGYRVSGEDALTTRKVYEDNMIGMEVRRVIRSTANSPGTNYFGGFNKVLFLRDYLYKSGFDPALDTNPDLRLRNTNDPGLLVSKNTRPLELRAAFQRRLDATDPGSEDLEAFGDRSHPEQWYQTSEDLMPIGNIGYNKTTTITLPAVDFGAATEFTFTAEVDWTSELADNLTDYENRVPDRIDITNTDNTFNAALPRGGSGGSTLQHNNGLVLGTSPNLGSNPQLAALRTSSATITYEMRYIDSSDKVEILESNMIARGLRTGLDNNGIGANPTLAQIQHGEVSIPNLFTATGTTQKASVIWPSIVIRRPSGIYTTQCSLYRDVIRSVILRFDVEDRTVSQQGIVYSGLSDGTGNNWIQITYAPAFVRTPALIIDPVNLGQGQLKQTRNENNRGFEVRFVDAEGLASQKVFSFVAIGFGIEINASVERLPTP